MAALSTKQKALFDALHNSRSEDFKTFNKKSYRGFWEQVINKYPESAHFVYELLQNADDAEATRVEIILRNDQLLFKHNGKKHFDITEEDAEHVGDINSITGIGDSSKIDIQNKIGKFGVGFKAVFQYTDTPQIYDDYFKFKIENIIIPALLDNDHPYRKEGETLFVLPFKDKGKCYADIVERLKKLKNPLLFLRHLELISWRIEGNSSNAEVQEYLKSEKEKYSFNDGTTLQLFDIYEQETIKSIFLFSKEVSLVDRGGRKTNHLIHVGFYYDAQTKRLITGQTQYIHCFFPTKETFNTCFISHAPFLLTDNRQSLKPGEELNSFLVEQLAQLAASAIVHLRDYGIDHKNFLINENLTEIIPYYHVEYWDSLDPLFESPMNDAFHDLIHEERIFLSRNGKYLSISEAYSGTPRDLVDLLTKEQLVELLTNREEDEYYDEDQVYDAPYEKENIDFLKWELAQNIINQKSDLYDSLDNYSSDLFAQDITASFMSKQDIKWVTKMYTFLRTAAPKLWKITNKDSAQTFLPFRHAPIIKTQSGQWVAPFVNNITPNVFLPLKTSQSSHYNFIAQEYLNNEIARKFIIELDIKEPDEFDYINNVIMPKYRGPQIKATTKEIDADFSLILSYFKKVQNTNSERRFINLLKEKFCIACTDQYFRYLNVKIYIHSNELEQYFKNVDNIAFFNISYYEKSLREYGEEYIKQFIVQLGVKEFPEISLVHSYSSSLSDRLKEQILIPNVSTYQIEDYKMEGFSSFCEEAHPNKDVSVFLWNKVLPYLHFGKFENLRFIYREKYARTYKSAYYTSTFKDSLQYSEWVYDTKGKLCSPIKIALEDLAPEYDRNNGLIHFLGVEKREKSITELGGTQEQQDNMELGKLLKNYVGNDLSNEEILRAVVEAKAKKIASLHQSEEEKIRAEEIRLQKEKQKTIDDLRRAQKEEDLYTHKQTKHDANDTFDAPAINTHTTKRALSETNALTDEQVELMRQQEETRKQLKEIASDSDKKYTYEWFKALLELEFQASGEASSTKRGIEIVFSKVEKDPYSERGILLRNPSRHIPLLLEDMGNIAVTFYLPGDVHPTITFEVASVQDYVLRLKGKNEDIEELDKLIAVSDKVYRAELKTGTPIQLIAELQKAYNMLELDEDYSLRDNIDETIKFIFGPPGTGKTTHLVTQWINKVATRPIAKMLVLCPTNKAADVIASRALEKIDSRANPENWVYRFVATAEDSLANQVCSRDSRIYEQDKCCIISTIARFAYDGFTNAKLKDIEWDYIIIDEASMIPLAQILYPIYKCQEAQFVIAGDPFQIEPIVHEEIWKEENIYKMIQLDNFRAPKTVPYSFEITNLPTQYRAVPAIGNLYSEYAYDGGVSANRKQNSQRKLGIKGYDIKSVNFVMFPVQNMQSIYGAQNILGSNIHIYSALFTYEFTKYLAKNIQDQADNKPWRIGIISPYKAQAEMINKLWEQRDTLYDNVEVSIGTVHGFQGDECDIIIAVYNPPASGMKRFADQTFVNKKNILNVAISRAQDYLFILMPDEDYENFDRLETKTIGFIANKNPEEMTKVNSQDIEKVIFNDSHFIEKNTFVTAHQMANVYSAPSSQYEVRFDEKSVDVQIK